MYGLHKQHEHLIRLALQEAIVMVESTINCYLPPKPSDDNVREKHLRAQWKMRVRRWRSLLRTMGGKVPGEFTVDEEISR